ncbi:MAG: fatty acid desaturase [Aureispira sp.]
MLKYKADLKTLLWMSITTSLFVYLWTNWGAWETNKLAFAGLYVGFLFMSVTVSVVAHNIMHESVFKFEPLNRLMEYWVIMFYGTPVFGWIPTHNRNHHRHNNKEPDYTKTYRYTEKNRLWVLLTYPFISNYFQSVALREFLKERFQKNRREFWLYISQIALVLTWGGTFLYLNPIAALVLVIIPHNVSLYSVVVFNFVQHVHADEESEYNHSRNYVGTGFMSLNWLLFNNGFHTVHHMNANLHWSLTREAHEKIAHKIDPSLNEPSFWGYIFRAYIISPFNNRFRTKSMRLERKAKEAELAKIKQDSQITAATH